jgi:hypothetical protein
MGSKDGKGLRAAILATMTAELEPGKAIALRLPEYTHKQVADSLCALHLSERVVRHGTKSYARWRLPTAAEAADAERRRARGRGDEW